MFFCNDPQAQLTTHKANSIAWPIELPYSSEENVRADENLLITYYIMGSVCALLNFLVVMFIVLKAGFRTPPMEIVLYIHAALTIECIISIPRLYIYTGAFCKIIGFFRAYFGLVNIISVFILVLHYRLVFSHDWQNTRSIILNHREKLIFLLPLITLLPLIGNAYGISDSDWCGLDTTEQHNRIWAFSSYYFWVMFISFLSTFVLIVTCVALYKAHPKLLSSMFSSTGVYVICSILSWIPRMLAFAVLDIVKNEDTFIFLYIFGIGYFLIFVYKRKVLEEFERTAQGQGSECSSFFSWEIGLSDSFISGTSTDKTTLAKILAGDVFKKEIGEGEGQSISSLRLSLRSLTSLSANNSININRASIQPVNITQTPQSKSSLRKRFSFARKARKESLSALPPASPPPQSSQEMPCIVNEARIGQGEVLSPLAARSSEGSGGAPGRGPPPISHEEEEGASKV